MVPRNSIKRMLAFEKSPQLFIPASRVFRAQAQNVCGVNSLARAPEGEKLMCVAVCKSRRPSALILCASVTKTPPVFLCRWSRANKICALPSPSQVTGSAKSSADNNPRPEFQAIVEYRATLVFSLLLPGHRALRRNSPPQSSSL